VGLLRLKSLEAGRRGRRHKQVWGNKKRATGGRPYVYRFISRFRVLKTKLGADQEKFRKTRRKGANEMKP
jgi:hypothetical protein